MTDHLAPPTPEEGREALRRLYACGCAYEGPSTRLLRDLIDHYEQLLEDKACLVDTIQEMERDIPEPEWDEDRPCPVCGASDGCAQPCERVAG